ncbi:MAG: hypothetical protein Q7T08_00965 [Devosia sp.]|nr:hypothetical protein [Devosia sp.]
MGLHPRAVPITVQMIDIRSDHADIVPLLARVTLGEALSPQYLLGLAVAIGGNALIHLS